MTVAYPSIGGPRWYAVYAQRNRECEVARNLAAQGFDVFLPLYWKTIRHARRFHTARSPLFPRYLFVRLDLSRDRWRSVNGTVGVSGLIAMGTYPTPVPSQVVEDLRVLAGADGLVSAGEALRPGVMARIAAGPLANWVGEVQSFSERRRVKVLLDIMGGRISIEVGSGALVPLG